MFFLPALKLLLLLYYQVFNLLYRCSKRPVVELEAQKGMWNLRESLRDDTCMSSAVLHDVLQLCVFPTTPAEN